MSRYVNADALIERWNNMSVRGRTEFDQEIMVAPSIDIVRCKECKYWHNKLCATWSQFRTIETEADDFCSYGEREERNK